MKKLFLLFVCFCAVTFIFAFPGINYYMNDVFGEYVYYRDFSFKSETYYGILKYDEETYALRYYSPNPQKGSSEIVLYFTVNPQKDTLELTGEKIATPVTDDDVDIINYLHDILYDFTAKRKKMNESIFSKPVTQETDYYQFGGPVTITYDFYVPIFNISRICTADNALYVQAVTFGQLENNEDPSFFTFFPDKIFTIAEQKEFSIEKDAQPLKIQIYSQTAMINSNWEQKMENMWMLNGNAIFVLDVIGVNPEAFVQVDFSVTDYFTRVFCSSMQQNYIYTPTIQIENQKDRIILHTTAYNPVENVVMRDIKVLIKLEEYKYAAAMLNVYNELYNKHKTYFDTIIDSIAVHE